MEQAGGGVHSRVVSGKPMTIDAVIAAGGGRQRAVSGSRIAAAFACCSILLAPALWNRYPLLQYDTGGYLARWFEHTLEESRSTVYGLSLDVLARPDFWPA